MTRLSYIILDQLSSFDCDDDIRRTLNLLSQCGYEGVEFNITEPLGVDTDSLAKWIADAGLVLASFLTGQAYSEQCCLSSPDALARERAVTQLINCLDTARQFDALLVIGLLQGLRSDEPNTEIANQRIVAGLGRVAAEAEAKGVQLIIEPVNHLQVGFNNSVAEVRSLIGRIGSPAIKPMVDTIHMNIEERSLTQPILECGTQLAHVHLCESNGSHFGTGHIDFASVLRVLDEIEYDRFASVKIYRGTKLEQDARSAIEYIRSVMKMRL